MSLKKDLSAASVLRLANQRPVFPFAVLLGVAVLLTSCCLLPFRERVEEEVVLMEVTAYCACQQCTGWERRITSCFMPVYAYGPSEGKRKKVGITSEGTKARRGTIAADITKYPYGTRMYIPGYGWGEVHDKGSAIQGDHIDIFFEDHAKAIKWGSKKLQVIIRRDK